MMPNLKHRLKLLTATCVVPLALSGCYSSQSLVPDFVDSVTSRVSSWSMAGSDIERVTPETLQDWWMRFDDKALNTLIDLTLEQSPSRRASKARIQEARGLRRNIRSFLLPQLGAGVTGSREDSGFAGTPDEFYDARFDAEFEVDVFGRNRKNLKAADAEIAAREARYHDVSLSLIAEVARTYIDYRANQKQSLIAVKNLDIQVQTLELIETQFELGEAPRLDVERAENIVNTTRASIPEFQRLAENARLRMVVLTGAMPDDLSEILSEFAPIPAADLTPVLNTPADVLAQRPDIQAATRTLRGASRLAEAETAGLFPTFTLSGFFGRTDSAFVSAATVWSVAAGAAVSLIDFGRIEGRIDAARALEVATYESYRETVLGAVAEVETALLDHTYIRGQRISLNKAFDNANTALSLSQDLYREGEISFIDVLDAQRTANDAESALVTAEAAQAESLVRIYKSLGVY